MIGGYDIVLDSQVEPAEALRNAWLFISSLWPNAVVEDGETGNVLPVTSSPGAFAERTHIFIYKDEKWRKAWDEQGGEPENLGTMIHVLASPGMATLVVDDPDEPVAKQVIQDMTEYLENEALQLTASPSLQQ